MNLKISCSLFCIILLSICIYYILIRIFSNLHIKRVVCISNYLFNLGVFGYLFGFKMSFHFNEIRTDTMFQWEMLFTSCVDHTNYNLMLVAEMFYVVFLNEINFRCCIAKFPLTFVRDSLIPLVEVTIYETFVVV